MGVTSGYPNIVVRCESVSFDSADLDRQEVRISDPDMGESPVLIKID